MHHPEDIASHML